MRQNHGYEINFEESKIIVTKSFYKEAGIIGSTAYNELAQVRRDYPDYPITIREIKKKPGKKTYGKLNYKTMADFITAFEGDNADLVLAEFERVKDLSKSYNGAYAYVKTWFLNRYKDIFKSEDEGNA